MRKKKIAPRPVPVRRAGRAASRGSGARSELTQNLLRSLTERHGVTAGHRIGIAVSGGADSVALLRLLLELREQLGIVLSVVHLNHKLRGKAADRDEAFVGELAAHYGLPFHVARENIAAKAIQERANVEDAARRARYAYFERLVSDGRVDRVAVAHTADDQAETVLSHILRGTGIAGVGGIHPEAGAVFRPLLRSRRGALRAYLRSLGQAWREDATNQDVKRTRARIRHKLIPFLEKVFQPAAVEHLCQLADLAREDDAWLESSAELRLFLGAREEKVGWRVPTGELIAPRVNKAPGSSADSLWSRHAAEAMSKRMIRLLVKKVKPRSGQLSALHVDAVLRLARLQDSGKSLQLPGGVEVRKEYDSLVFRPMEATAVSPQNAARFRSGSRRNATPFAYAVDLDKGEMELHVLEHSCALRFQVIDWPRQGRETKGTGAVLDRDKLRKPLVVRNWQPGDAVQALGHQKSHTLSRLLNEAGVSRWEKESWPVLTSAGKIAWSCGLPVAAEFAVGESTRAGVRITEVPLS
jgi:tRNA(Ile)-lysidine synthase